ALFTVERHIGCSFLANGTPTITHTHALHFAGSVFSSLASGLHASLRIAMHLLKQLRSVSFRTKVLGPVILVMVLLVGTSMWLVNRRVTRQVQADAAQQLATAEAVFKTTQRLHADDLFLRYRNV